MFLICKIKILKIKKDVIVPVLEVFLALIHFMRQQTTPATVIRVNKESIRIPIANPIASGVKRSLSVPNNNIIL
jgi:hypothetical protein